MVIHKKQASVDVCPFCGYEPAPGAQSETALYDLAQHIELDHREPGSGPSAFQVNDGGLEPPSRKANRGTDRRPNSSSSSSHTSEREMSRKRETEYVACPRDCGEMIPRQMMDQHVNLHQAEDVALDELEGQYGAVDSNQEIAVSKINDNNMINEGSGKKPGNQKRDIFKEFFSGSLGKSTAPKSGQRLGRKELGPHAYEEKMPSWLFRQLKEGPPVTWMDQTGPDGRLQRVERVANETPGLVAALAELCREDRTVSKVWLCSPGAKHIFKMRREGGFCGYRNIQMQVSWMQHHQYPGHAHFGPFTPNILDLQVMIEQAWESGINSSGKVETGGIIGTRKYIGTPEAQALFQYLGIPCNAQAITKSKIADRKDPVYAVLLEYVLEYFSKDVIDPAQKVYMTSLPPIYFQHPGHSLTIVGIEIHKNGNINLLVFDPMFPTVPAMIRFLGAVSAAPNPSKILRSFRRGEDYLKKYKTFEVLSLAGAARPHGGTNHSQG